eukprot:191192-Rhodomonas_salina.1
MPAISLGDSYPIPAISIRAAYAIPALECPVLTQRMVLRACYALPGTDRAYVHTRLLRATRY